MLRQLFQKEIRLQKSNLYFVLAIILVWGILLALATRAEVKISGSLDTTMGAVVSFLQVGFVGFCLLVVVPLLVGAAMVAEERKLGVWEWQLSLPCSRLIQWVVKMSIGFAITLALTLVIQPLLDFVLSRVLGDQSDLFPSLSSMLAQNEQCKVLPLFLMASAAFVSSMSKDSYKAFFLGIVFSGFVVGCFTVNDPTGILILPWTIRKTHLDMRLLAVNTVPWHLGLGLSVVLCALGWFNFRLEGFRWRRFFGLLAFIAFLPTVMMWIVLHAEFGIGGLVSQNAKDVEPLISRNRQGISGSAASVNWTGIDPLLVRRSKPTFWANKERFRQRTEDGYFLSRTLRLSDTGRILAEINTAPLIDTTHQGLPPQVVELGVDKRYFRPILSLLGRVSRVLPKNGGYIVQNQRYNSFLVTHWPLPIKVSGLLWGIVAHGAVLDDPWSAVGGTLRNPIEVDGKKVEFWSVNPVNPDKGYYELWVRKNRSSEEARLGAWLIQRKTDGVWTAVDKKGDTWSYRVSTDGKWFANECRPRGHAGSLSSSSLSLYSCDHTASWTLSNVEGDLAMASNNGYRDFDKLRDMGTQSFSHLRVSPSGRFLPFLRTKTIKLEADGKEYDTRYPRVVEFALLDLQTGQESVLYHTPPDHDSQKRFQKAMKQWNLWKSEQKAGRAEKDESSRQTKGRLTPGSKIRFPFPCYYQHLPPLLWAPDRDALAILFDEKIYLFERRAQNEKNAAKQTAVQEVTQNMDDFQLLGTVDLTGFQIWDMDFWNSGVMLAWGGTGLYRIDLAKALRPTQIPVCD